MLVTKKKRLEAELKRDLVPLFNEIVSDFEIIYSQTGKTFDADAYNAELISLLIAHYRKVLDKFGFLLSDREDINSEELENLLQSAHLLYSLNRSDKQSKIITSTTNSDIDKSINEATSFLLVMGLSTSRDSITEEASKRLSSKLTGRSTVISNVETQGVAEEARLMERIALSGDSPYGGLAGTGLELYDNPTKTWVADLDEKTRPAHVLANGQTVPYNGLFLVKGQYLRFPGDMSFGASMDNVANCRCEVSY